MKREQLASHYSGNPSASLVHPPLNTLPGVNFPECKRVGLVQTPLALHPLVIQLTLELCSLFYPGRREQKQIRIPPAGKQAWRACLSPVQAGPQPLPAAPSSPRTGATTTTRLRAPEGLACIFSNPMYFRKRCRSNVFPCTERWMGPPVNLSQLLGCLPGWPAKGRERVWALVWMLMGQPPWVAP